MSIHDSRWLFGPSLAIVVVVAAAVVAAGHSDSHASLYAVTDAGVAFESTNDGVTWSAKGQIPEPSVVSLSPGLTTGTLFALGRSGALYKSSDAGVSWSVVGNAGASDCVSLAIARGGALIALTQSGDVIRTTNGGTSWTTTSSVGASDCAALAVGGKVGSSDTLFAVTSSGDVAMSPTGSSWRNVGTTSYTPIVDLLWIAKTLYALTDAGEVLKSSNNGVNWVAVGTISQVGMRELTYVGGTFKAISKEGEVYESASGTSWSSSWIGTTNQVFTVAFAPGAPEFQTGVQGPPVEGTGLAIRVFPNPCSDAARLALAGIADGTRVEVTVFDVMGRRVAEIYAGQLPSGAREVSWRPFDFAPGTYFLRLTSPHGDQATERVTIVR